MDVKCVRVLRPYDNPPEGAGIEGGMTIYIDEEARYALNKQWGDKVEAKGRRVIEAVIRPLAPMDQDGFIARAEQAVIDALFIEYGEEILLH
jgi:hypothetical protein